MLIFHSDKIPDSVKITAKGKEVEVDLNAPLEAGDPSKGTLKGEIAKIAVGANQINPEKGAQNDADAEMFARFKSAAFAIHERLRLSIPESVKPPVPPPEPEPSMTLGKAQALADDIVKHNEKFRVLTDKNKDNYKQDLEQLKKAQKTLSSFVEKLETDTSRQAVKAFQPKLYDQLAKINNAVKMGDKRIAAFEKYTTNKQTAAPTKDNKAVPAQINQAMDIRNEVTRNLDRAKLPRDQKKFDKDLQELKGVQKFLEVLLTKSSPDNKFSYHQAISKRLELVKKDIMKAEQKLEAHSPKMEKSDKSPLFKQHAESTALVVKEAAKTEAKQVALVTKPKPASDESAVTVTKPKHK